MTVQELQSALSLSAFALPDPDREVTGGYAGDLLSWVMGRASAGDCWVTIMSNANIVAVASLADTALILLAEGVQPDAGVAESAQARGVNLLGSGLPAYTLCGEVSKLL